MAGKDDPLLGDERGQAHTGPHPSVGINAKRGCTDCFFLLFYALVWGGMIYLAQLAIMNGDPWRLVYGTDYMGNVCSDLRDGVPNVTEKLANGSSVRMTASQWGERGLLWYPITYDYKSQKMLVKEALSLGICVSECPQMGDVVEGYGTATPLYSETATYHALDTSPKWPVLFDSNVTFYRCVPDFLHFDCMNASECLGQLGTAADKFGEDAQIGSVIKQGIAEIVNGWWILALGPAIAAVIAYIWLFMLRRFVKPFVILTVILAFLLLAGGGAICWIMKGRKADATPPQPDASEYYMYGAIVFWIISFLYLCLLAFLWKDIMIACDIIEEASKVPVQIPTMFLLPLLLMVMIAPMVIFHTYVAIYIQSSGDTINVQLPVPQFLPNVTVAGENSSVVNTFDWENTNLRNISGDGGLIEVKEYEIENWRTYGHLYNLFVFLWGFGFVNAIGYLTLAFCGVFWYFSNPGDDKSPPWGSVCIGLKYCFRYHIGTLAFGSLLVALVQLMRVIMLLIEQRMKELGERTNAIKLLFKCIHCCLACLERIVKFINKNAYIGCAITGNNFISSARDGLDLLSQNALTVGALTVISEYIMIFAKIVIVIATTLAAWAIMGQAENTSYEAKNGITNGVLLLILVAIIAYFIACLFIAVFAVCIDTILLCYCYDRKHQEYAYFPSDLKKHLDASELRVAAKNPKTEGSNGSEMSKMNPLPRSEVGTTPAKGRVLVGDDDL